MRSTTILLILAVLISLVSCSKESGPSTRTETFEIYSTKGDAMNKEIDSLKFFESSEYQGDKIMTTSYFDHTGELTGKQIFSYTKGTDLIRESNYYDAEGKLMSTYRYVYDLKGNKIAAYAYQAENEELFRVETYVNQGENVVTKRIHDPDFSVYRKYDFGYDNYGNETSMKVEDGNGQLLVAEEFRITKRDSTQKWLEKWGFMDEKPVTFHKRMK